jgi:pimeloyl-ACP methyl ester carboxylesterase
MNGEAANSGGELAEQLLFLPGASGNTQFWQPVADKLLHPAPRQFWGWPGFAGVPSDPSVRGISDLVDNVTRDITRPVDLIAQSMGGVIAVRAALAKPELVRHLVLCVTSGGIDVAALGGKDWRPEFFAQNPHLPRWFLEERTDLSPRLAELTLPVLLLWGDADPISPLAVGERLHSLLPNSTLTLVPGGTHDLAIERSTEVAALIDAHLAAPKA